MAGSESRTALFLLESETLALDMQGILRSGGLDWTVMLTRAPDAACSALLSGSVDLAVLIPDLADTVSDLLVRLRDTDTPTILVAGPGTVPVEFRRADLLVRLSFPLDADRLGSVLKPFALGHAPGLRQRACCA